jgi:hypothetical protein
VAKYIGGKVGLTAPADASDSPPEEGWRYWDGTEYRPGVQLAPATALPCCPALHLSARGEARRRYPEVLGAYRRVAGLWSQGRWVGPGGRATPPQVYRGGLDSTHYLAVRPGYSAWDLTTDLGSPSGGSISSPSGPVCPEAESASRSARFGLNSWLYVDGDTEGVDTEGDITLECA